MTLLNRYLGIGEINRMTDIFLKKGEVRTFKNKHVFLREGEASNLIGYVTDGGFRHLKHVSEGKDRIAGYSFTGDFITAFHAFNDDVSAVTIQAIRKSTIRILPREDIEGLLSWELRCRIAQVSLSDIYGRLLMVHTATQEERYVSLITNVPDILNEVSLREIASYLGMTPATLSRIRKNLSKPSGNQQI